MSIEALINNSIDEVARTKRPNHTNIALSACKSAVTTAVDTSRVTSCGKPS